MHRPWLAAAIAATLLGGCAATREPSSAVGATARTPCAQLAGVAYPLLRIVSAQAVAAGTLKLPGIAQPMPEHCVVSGRLAERKGPVDGKDYAIGFEMRLPTAWNGRFFYQANGGLDGFVTPAYGNILGGAPTTNGLANGFAVLSSDAGHAFDRANPVIGAATFGLDPQARRELRRRGARPRRLRRHPRGDAGLLPAQGGDRAGLGRAALRDRRAREDGARPARPRDQRDSGRDGAGRAAEQIAAELLTQRPHETGPGESSSLASPGSDVREGRSIASRPAAELELF